MDRGKHSAVSVLSVLSLMIAVWASAAEPASERTRKLNIILCMTDDQDWSDVSYNGLKQIQTPNLDAMAAEGIRFNRFYAAHPSCSPTRASLMTGPHPYRMGVFWPGMPLKTEEMTIAQAVTAFHKGPTEDQHERTNSFVPEGLSARGVRSTSRQAVRLDRPRRVRSAAGRRRPAPFGAVPADE